MRPVRFGRPRTSPRVLHFLVSRGDMRLSTSVRGFPRAGRTLPHPGAGSVPGNGRAVRAGGRVRPRRRPAAYMPRSAMIALVSASETPSAMASLASFWVSRWLLARAL